MKIAYLVNHYPHVSHSFIRREIVGIEAWKIDVARFSIRPCTSNLVDEADKLELEKTQSILGVGIIALLLAVIRVFLTQPFQFFRSLQLTWKIGWHSDRGIIRNLAYLAEACVLLGQCSESEISHIHAHFGTNSTTVAMLCHALGGPPYSFTVHGPQEFDRATVLALDEKVKRASFVVTISSFGKSQLYRWCDRQYWSKIHVVHCGLDEKFLNAEQTPMSDEPRLVCVGRLDEQKGHLLLVEAAAKLAKKGLDFKLVFVGDGSLRTEIETAIARLKLHNHIEITGWASNSQVREQILAARALVLASFAEGLPVVAMEALALGRPVISTCVAGVPELIEHGNCGWLITPGSLDDLTATMGKVLQLPVDKLKHMGTTGSELVAQRHNIAFETAKLAELFWCENISLTIKANTTTTSSNSLKKRAIFATIWTLFTNFAGQLMRFIANLILTRLLVPEYFGLMALVHTFISGLAMFSDIGIGPSIIRHKRGDDPDFLNTAWTLQVLRGFGLWLITLLITWPVATFYKEPKLLLLIPVIGLNVVIDGFKSTGIFTLNRHLLRGKLTRFELVGVGVKNIVTISWAWLNPTVWALIGGSFVSGLVDLVRSHKLVPEITNRFTWDEDAVQELVSFGKWIFISTAMTFLAMQSDRLILGKLFSLEMLGVYTVAFTLADLPKLIFGSLSGNVIFPIISKFAELPRESLRAKILPKRWLLLVGMGFCVAVLVFCGDFLILALYDQRYNDAAWMLPILALGIWPYLLMQLSGPTLLAVGKPIYLAWGNFLKFTYMLFVLPLAFSYMGLLGAVIAIALNDIPLYIAINYGLWREELAAIVQDIQATLLLLGLIAILCSTRYLLGFGLSIDAILR
ncbi:MAG: oligosaccharide flippase family protein [Calothrix sp. MO_167.B42]|nr:oligosaccharide flippase family protein [Calothrix sp. MO_167.B42]